MIKKVSNKNLLLFIVLVISIGLIFSVIIVSGNQGQYPTEPRPKYCKEYCVPDDVFYELPPYPKGMEIVKTRIDAGLYPIMENFGAVKDICMKWNLDYTKCLEFPPDEAFYKQPEFFFKSWTSENIERYYLPLGNPKGYNFTYVGIQGYGAFPGIVEVRPIKEDKVLPGMTLKSITYFRTGWGIKNYQGIHLYTHYPKLGKLRNKLIEQNPELVKNYFKITITPEEFVLGPTFPSKDRNRVFDKDWVRKITILIKVNKNTPPGTYIIDITTGPVSRLNNTIWSNKYGFRYYEGGMFGTEPPPFQMFITVSL
ncbi:MAG: hypothetical protein ACE5KT_00360 [Methanosarcinales archaeon]